MRKMQEMTKGDSCLNKAAPDEPVFVLRANPLTNRFGRCPVLRLRIAYGMNEPTDPKLVEAAKLADEMEEWRKNNAAKEMQTIRREDVGEVPPGII